MTLLPGADFVALLPALTPEDSHRLLADASAELRRIHTWGPADLAETPPAMLKRVLDAGLKPEITFCHGDYCLPNIMVADGRVSGVIDWPHAGYLDRRINLAAACKCIRRNLKDEAFVETFLRAYGHDGLFRRTLRGFLLSFGAVAVMKGQGTNSQLLMVRFPSI